MKSLSSDPSGYIRNTKPAIQKSETPHEIGGQLLYQTPGRNHHLYFSPSLVLAADAFKTEMRRLFIISEEVEWLLSFLIRGFVLLCVHKLDRDIGDDHLRYGYAA